MNCLWMNYWEKKLPEGAIFFSAAQKMMQNTQDQVSVKEPNYIPLFMAFTKCF